MKLVNAQNRIQELMSRFVVQIEMGAAMSRTDLNKVAETILIPLLNEVYSWNLENINYTENDNNYPGIDLVDEIARISIQVTATPTLEKVKHTLKQFIKRNQYLKYDRLIIYILKRKQDSYSEKAIQGIIQNKFNFESQKNIWDYCDILKEVSNFQIDKTLRVKEILEAYFGEDRRFPSMLADRSRQKIDWRETCRDLLSHWKGLTTNGLMRRNGVRFQLDEIFVPLGVVERRVKPKYRSNDGASAEQGSELYEEKITPISQNDFFEHVLRQRQSKHSQGKRIAIIGEPGAGKTTQLQKIGDWVLEETDGIPIWIPLAEVGTRKLREYLLGDWLQTAIQELEVLPEHRDELGQLLKTGKVWLLLDGVDEMAISDALYQIATQMREGWLQNVRVVLTCRLNVWDAGKNALDGFDVYRNLDFEYPTEVHQLVDKWFATEPALQQKLKVALEQPGKERIRDMVKNPLRSTLLCYSWQLRQGELPETKAGLYEWFVDTFYEWNKGKVPIQLSAAKREELNRALGELAKEAIDQESSRFRLREKFVNQFLGAADDEDSLFYLALQLGWLNRMGVAEENPLENVYAFFHPTFQEYFAALAIDDWDYFLPFEDTDQSSEDLAEEDECYRIFEPQWIEVILLWIGRPDLSKHVKQDFVDNLVSFEDMCIGCYDDRAFFLAASLITEFNKCNLADEIAHQLIAYAFGNYEDSEWVKASDFIVDTAKSFIPKASQQCLFSTIEKTYKSKPDTVKFEIAELLIDSCKNNRLSTEILENLAVHSRDAHISLRASTKLLNISIDNEIAIKALEILTISCGDDSIRVEAATELLSNDPQNQNALRVLIEAAGEKHDILAVEGLSYAYGNVKAIEVLRQIIEELEPIIKDAYDKDEDEDEDEDEEPECSLVYWAADDSLYRISPQPETSSQGLNAQDSSFFIPDDDYINDRILEDLEELERYVSSILWTNKGKIIEDEKLFEELLEVYLQNYSNDKDEVLTEKTQTEIQISEVTQVILHNIEELLGGKDSIIAKVLDLICSTGDDEVFYDTLSKLEEISNNDVSALNGVISLAVRGTRSHRLNMVIYAIANIGGINNLIAINFLLSVIVTPQREEIKWVAEHAVESLKEILQSVDLMVQVVAFIEERTASVDLEANPEVFTNCYSVLWHCSQYLSYIDFFNAWHSSSPIDDDA